MKLKGRVAIVTGASSGIGKAIAVRLAAEGASVSVGDMEAERGKQAVEEIRSKGCEASFFSTDVSKSEDVRRLVDNTVSRYGALHILVNNAGIALFGKVPDFSEDDWDRVINVNLKGVFLGCKYGIPVMKAAGGGSIINIGSTTSIMGMTNLSAYSASKGAVAQLTKCLALDHGVDKIRVNCICPGATLTGPVAKEKLDWLERLAKEQPAGRYAMPDEIANVAAFLASDEASYMTGSLVVVDGGEIAGKIMK